MKEEDEDLIGLWKSSDQSEKKMEATVSHFGESYFQKQGKDIFQRIRRNMVVELWASAVAAIGFPFILKDDPFFWWLTGLMVIAVIVTIRIYGSYFRSIRQIHEGSIIESLTKKKDVLGKYLRRMHLTNYIIVPLSVGVGYFRADTDIVLFSEHFYIALAICAVTSAVFIILIRMYIQALYGKYYEQVTEMLNRLE